MFLSPLPTCYFADCHLRNSNSHALLVPTECTPSQDLFSAMVHTLSDLEVFSAVIQTLSDLTVFSAVIQTLSGLEAISSGVEKNTSSTSRVWSSSCVEKKSKKKQSSLPTFFIQCTVFFRKKITWPAVILYVVMTAPSSITSTHSVSWNVNGRAYPNINLEQCSSTFFHYLPSKVPC